MKFNIITVKFEMYDASADNKSSTSVYKTLGFFVAANYCKMSYHLLSAKRVASVHGSLSTYYAFPR